MCIIFFDNSFYICRFSARGGFGIIYIGDLKKSGGSVQKVAIKVAKVAWDQKYEDMLFNEAKIMAQFDHKNVVKLLAFQKSPLKVVMEYLELKNLELAIQASTLLNNCYFICP